MNKDNDALKNTKPSEQAPGEGIRKLKTTNVFRTLNFELYVKPVSILNKLEFFIYIYRVVVATCPYNIFSYIARF